MYLLGWNREIKGKKINDDKPATFDRHAPLLVEEEMTSNNMTR